MKFVLFGNKFHPDKAVFAAELAHALARHGDTLYVYRDFYDYLVHDRHIGFEPNGIIDDNELSADMVLSMGGDGTFLAAAAKVSRMHIPILGINTGRLGFLADVSPEGIDEAILAIHRHEYSIESRSMLSVTMDHGPQIDCGYALNEVALLKHDSSSMISIRTSINHEYLTTYQADGLIVATPTGSTAYSLSVGGPIIVPSSQTFCITPVAPHSLNMRPIIINDTAELELTVESRSQHFLVAIDGRSHSCERQSIIHIQRAPFKIDVVKRPNQTFFQTLRTKMMWGADMR